MEVVRATFHDLDAMCEAVRAWDVEFYPLTKEWRGHIAGSFVQAFDSDYQYSYSEFSPGLSMFGTPPKDLITINIMEPTKRRYWVRRHEVDDGMAWVFPAGSELRSVSAPCFQVHTLSVSEEQIERLAAALEINLQPPSKRPEVFPIPAEILSTVRNYLHQIRDGSNRFPIDPFHEVLQLLVPQWLQPNLDEHKRPTNLRARDVAVRRFIDIIDCHHPESVTNNVLLSECRVSERTLQYAIRERFDVTPHEFIKSMRLAKVRSALRHAENDEITVKEIAERSGVWHLGRFAADYRKAFGELPSQTLARKK